MILNINSKMDILFSEKEIDSLALSLQPFYSKFKVAERLLFSGHSHQAWPDAAIQGMRQYEEVVAQLVDKKWGIVFQKIEILKNYLRSYYNDPLGHYSYGTNTHTLLVSWLSSLDLEKKKKIITTTGQFHSLYRQLQLSHIHNTSIVVEVSVEPIQTLTQRLLSEVDENTSAVMCSRVFFESSKVNKNIKELAEGCRKRQVFLFIDDYHGTNVVPLSFEKEELDDIFLVTGGYKYLQWGEGNCFLRYPKGCNLYPKISGWKASYQSLHKKRQPGVIEFDSGCSRFINATFDATSAFRAAKVVQFFQKQSLTSQLLCKMYRSQTRYLRDRFKASSIDKNYLSLLNDEPVDNFGGFVAFYSQKAEEICAGLNKRDIFCDNRGHILRLGLAPYITTSQINKCIEILPEVINEIFRMKEQE